ncbi:MAG TPA: DUF4810 domain-containing protein [Candidatus Cloacimonadota bacterium]|nr:DUF4810 domain-containing protein [Candidatus Cloacimonadota bacterium]
MRIITMVLALLLLAGCAFTPEYLFYGDYSWAYYNHVKKQDERSLDRFQKELDKLITYADRYQLKVPPGVYADYALIMLEQNRYPQALRYFELEKEQWSDSAAMVDFLMQKYGIQD